jgi:hypothetical protein
MSATDMLVNGDWYESLECNQRGLVLDGIWQIVRPKHDGQPWRVGGTTKAIARLLDEYYCAIRGTLHCADDYDSLEDALEDIKGMASRLFRNGLWSDDRPRFIQQANEQEEEIHFEALGSEFACERDLPRQGHSQHSRYGLRRVTDK